MSPVLMVPVFALLIVCLICAFKESKTTARYKALKVYGRIKGYLFTDLLLVGIVAVVLPFVARLLPDDSLSSQELAQWYAIPLGLVCMAIAVWIYLSAKKKCPRELKGRLLGDMLVTGLGVSMKVAVFILPFVWKLAMPPRHRDGGQRRQPPPGVRRRGVHHERQPRGHDDGQQHLCEAVVLRTGDILPTKRPADAMLSLRKRRVCGSFFYLNSIRLISGRTPMRRGMRLAPMPLLTST